MKSKIRAYLFMVLCLFAVAGCTSDDGPETPETDMDDEIGGVADKNPYASWSAEGTTIQVKKVTKIEAVCDGITLTYTFTYDAKGRIIKYTTPNDVYTFIYDDEKLYLKCNGKLMNTSIFNSQGYLSKLWDGDENSSKTSVFTYNTNGSLTKLVSTGFTTTTWTPSYSTGYGGYATMTSLYPDNSHTFAYGSQDYGNLVASVDLNGFISSCYQWEWFMHLDKAEIILGLFDFYGRRGARIIKTETTKQWKNEFTPSYASTGAIVESVSQVRSGLNSNFKQVYHIYYAD